MQCQKCQTHNPTSANFCSRCGSPLPPEETAALGATPTMREARKERPPAEIPLAATTTSADRRREAQNIGTVGPVAADTIRRAATSRVALVLIGAAVLAGLACWAGWQWVLKPQAERREGIRVLRAEVQTALELRNLTDAEVKLAQLEQLNPTQTLDLKVRYGQLKDAKRGLDQKRETAGEARDRLLVAKLDAGQGIGAKLQAMGDVWTKAETNRLTGNWNEAEQDYQRVREQVVSLESLEKQRQAAWVVRKRAERARASAEAARARSSPSALWSDAGQMWTDAMALFEDGRFTESEEAFGKATASYERAKESAEGAQALAEAKTGYEQLLTRTLDVALLNAHGGVEWAAIRNSVAQAALENDARVAKKLYDEAREDWPKALSLARDRRDLERRSRIVEDLAAAKKALEQKAWSEVEQRIKRVLELDNANVQALDLQQQATDAAKKDEHDRWVRKSLNGKWQLQGLQSRCEMFPRATVAEILHKRDGAVHLSLPTIDGKSTLSFDGTLSGSQLQLLPTIINKGLKIELTAEASADFKSINGFVSQEFPAAVSAAVGFSGGKQEFIMRKVAE